MTKPLAILGGTFDPIHFGHLRAAWDAAEALDAEVRMVPSRVPPHRAQPVASAAQRARMLDLALAGQSRLGSDLRELEREGPSFTIDTLAALRAEIGPERPLVLLLGADAFAGLPTWHRWNELFDHAHVAVLTRPGHDATTTGELAAVIESRAVDSVAALRAGPCGLVARVAVTPLEISASTIRALLAAGHDPRFLMPDAVLEFARAERIYTAMRPAQ